jgi:hypothetical protein
MTVATAQISECLQVLIDSRLDTIDRMLLGRLSRQDRLGIVREVESQIHELLEECDTEELTREDVLGVLARLDPPEAYIPDEIEGERVSAQATNSVRTQRTKLKSHPKAGLASGLLGLAALALMLLMPMVYLIGVAMESSVIAIVLLGGNLLLMFSASVVSFALGIYARKSGPWAVVGIATSALAVFLSLAILLVAILDG